MLLLGNRYGARPPGNPLSYTELEYQWAATRRRVPLLAFVVDPKFPWPPPDVDHGTDAEALAAFKSRVRSRHAVKRLADVAGFREDLLIALSRVDLDLGRRAGKRRGRSATARAVGPIRAPVFHAVPPYVGSAPFTGRADDLAALDDWASSADPVMVVEAIGGTGKSALAWEWARERAPAAVEGLAGRLWWSFYDGSASITRFLLEFLVTFGTARISGRPAGPRRHGGRGARSPA